MRIKDIRAAIERKFYAAKKDDVGDLYIYDAIGGGFYGGISPNDVVSQLDSLKGVKTLNLYINSPGGVVFDGVAIYNVLKRFDAQKNVFVDGVAASIASIIAMAGDKITIASNAMMMIHDPWGLVIGSSAEMRDAAETLDQIRGTLVDTYVARTKQTPEVISKWMSDETWMNATEAVQRGFADATEDEDSEEAQNAIQPHMFDTFKNTPERFKKASNVDVALAVMDQRLLKSAKRTSPR